MRPDVRKTLLLAGLIVGAFATSAMGLPQGVRILAPADVLAERTQSGEDGTLFLEDEWGILRRFVTSTADPLIANPGDGEFHPVEVDPVVQALEGADERFTSRIAFDAYILPYPVAYPLTSWADGRAIYLSPGVRQFSERQIHYLVSHEVGHLIHRQYLPDEDSAGWMLFRQIRGIQDSTRYNEEAIHRDRPHEIFAEDFRYLFGSRIGRTPDGIENADLPSPDQVPGLRDFFLNLIGLPAETMLAAGANAYPNPCRSGVALRFQIASGTDAAAIEIYDVTGRSVRRIERPTVADDGTITLDWTGFDEGNEKLSAGVYFCRVLAGAASRTIPFRFIP